MLGFGAKLLFKLGKPWLYGLAMTAAQRAAVSLAGTVRRKRLIDKLEAAQPAELARIVGPFFAKHGFVPDRVAVDGEGVLLAGAVAQDGDDAASLFVVRIQAAVADCDIQVVRALEEAVGAEGSGLLIAVGGLPQDVREAVQASSSSLGVLDASEYANESSAGSHRNEQQQ